MSLYAFHVNFRATTSLTPLRFPKRFRLIEARCRMFALGEAISDAVSGVGYESVPQFTREYARIFGQPPARDILEVRARMSAAP